MYPDPVKDQYLFSIITFEILNGILISISTRHSNQLIENSKEIVSVLDYAMRFLNLYKEQVQCVNHLSLASPDGKNHMNLGLVRFRHFKYLGKEVMPSFSYSFL